MDRSIRAGFAAGRDAYRCRREVSSAAFRKHWTEPRVEPVVMSEIERYRWLAEYCNKFEYVNPTVMVVGHFILIDCDGEETIENNLSDAIGMAVAKFKERNE